MVAFLVWDQAVAGSSPVTSTEKDKPLIHNELAVLFFVRFWGKKNPQPRLMEIADDDRVLVFFVQRSTMPLGYAVWLCSECYRAVAHARGRSEGGQSRREDADDDLNDGLPSFLLHGS